LQIAEQPLPTYMDYSFSPQTNPFAGATNQFMGMTNQYANAVNPVLAVQRAAIPAATVPAVMPTAQSNLAAHIVPTAANSSNFENRPTNAAETSAWQASIPGAPDFITGKNGVTRLAYGTQDIPRYNYGTNAMPRYAMGTQDMPVGMDTQFMSGDSTSLDPMSGGARPETVSINDPTGDATFSVDPLQPPDGPSEGGRAAELSSLLKALSQFLDKGEEPAPMPVAPRYAFGTYMMPGYAYGTGIMESDNPYIDRVMAQRQATPYTMNTQAADYSFGSPTLRSINEMGAQVATGVPMVEFGYEANRLRPGMLSRDSLNLGQ